jgi:hypothetical protein
MRTEIQRQDLKIFGLNLGSYAFREFLRSESEENEDHEFSIAYWGFKSAYPHIIASGDFMVSVVSGRFVIDDRSEPIPKKIQEGNIFEQLKKIR